MRAVIPSLFIGLLLVTSAIDGYAQRKWKNEFYDELNDNNFRDFKLFQKRLNPNKIDFPLLHAALFYVTNEARLEQGLIELEYHPALEIMAYNHSITMAEDDFFDHENPKDKKRRTATLRAKRAGIINPNIGENIHAAGGRQFGTYIEIADYIVQSWIDSPPHRRTMFSKDALQLGCGVYFYDKKWQNYKDVYKQGNGFWIATQNFQMFKKIESGTSKDKGPKND